MGDGGRQTPFRARGMEKVLTQLCGWMGVGGPEQPAP